MRKEQADHRAVARLDSCRYETELARSARGARGIEAMVETDDCGSQPPLLGADAGVKSPARRSDQGKAQKLLE